MEQTPKSSIFFDSQSSTKMLKKMGIAFDFPKATELIEYLISMYPNNKAVTVLDFFAGSGTTGHAIIKLNKKDNGRRKFIMCTNNENGIAENVTYQRISKVVNGYANTDGIPANLRYFKTSFVDKAENTDQTRVALVARATDMIKVRENTFETVVEEDLFKAYEGADTYSVIAFDPSVIDEAKAEITKLSDDKAVRVYVFSLANDSYVSDFADLDRQVELCPIPESILEVYKRIFDQKGTK
jgi:adenine-specific DNA-methyltransferase